MSATRKSTRRPQPESNGSATHPSASAVGMTEENIFLFIPNLIGERSFTHSSLQSSQELTPLSQTQATHVLSWLSPLCTICHFTLAPAPSSTASHVFSTLWMASLRVVSPNPPALAPSSTWSPIVAPPRVCLSSWHLLSRVGVLSSRD